MPPTLDEVICFKGDFSRIVAPLNHLIDDAV
jgi:hypothetical protein